MTQHKLETIVYAQGYIEDFVEENTEPREIPEGLDDEEVGQEITDDNEHRQQARAMMRILSEGVDQLRRANASLENKLSLVRSALNTPT